MKHKLWWVLGIGLVVAVGASLFWPRPSRPVVHDQSVVPTFYLHGYSGTANSTNGMIATAEKQAHAKRVYVATVSDTGTVKLRGNWPAGVKRPLIQVIFKANRNSDYQITSAWFKRVLQAVARQHRFKQYNAVAHSMGNLTLWTAILRYNQQKNLPHAKKIVDLAGHFDGILGMDDRPNQIKLAKDGRPTPMHTSFRQLLPLRQQLANNQIQVLNGYGDLDDGSHSDGRVSNASSQSLRYLVAKRAKAYQEHAFHGPKAQHSQLHANAQVDRVIDHFLWP